MSEAFELAEWDPGVDLLGNVGFREVKLTGRQKLPGHEHNFPHATVVVRGKIRVTFTMPNVAGGDKDLAAYLLKDPWVMGRALALGDVWIEEHIAPSRFEVPARVSHQIESLCDEGAECWCVYGARDATGEIVEHVTEKIRRDRFWHERRGGGQQ